jgi:hypothetical protein
MAGLPVHFRKDVNLGVVGELTWTCAICVKYSGEYSWKSTTTTRPARLSGMACRNPDHTSNVREWLSREDIKKVKRLEILEWLQDRVEYLDLESDKKEIKLILFDFLHEHTSPKDTVLGVLDRLAEMEKNSTRAVLALAVLKALAHEESNDEPISSTNREFKTMQDVQDFVTLQRKSWKLHTRSIAASGKVQLILQLVDPFLHC